MTRDEMIDYLVDSDYHFVMENSNGPGLLDDYIRFGFKGYLNFSDEELKVEYQTRKQIESYYNDEPLSEVEVLGSGMDDQDEDDSTTNLN